MNHLPKAVAFPQYPSITGYDDYGEEEGKAVIGNIAEQYLRKFASKSGTDKTFGLRDMDGKFYIGNKKSKIKENNIIIGEKEYVKKTNEHKFSFGWVERQKVGGHPG